jgi:hypothetical protein
MKCANWKSDRITLGIRPAECSTEIGVVGSPQSLIGRAPPDKNGVRFSRMNCVNGGLIHRWRIKLASLGDTIHVLEDCQFCRERGITRCFILLQCFKGHTVGTGEYLAPCLKFRVIRRQDAVVFKRHEKRRNASDNEISRIGWHYHNVRSFRIVGYQRQTSSKDHQQEVDEVLGKATFPEPSNTGPSEINGFVDAACHLFGLYPIFVHGGDH